MRTKAAETGAALFGRSKQAVLALLFGHPGRDYYLRELARAAGTSPSSLQRDLAALALAGIIERAQRGNRVHFRANRRSPIYEELRGLVVKTFGVADVLREALAPLASRIAVAFVYGSVARGDQRLTSDVDVMVIGNASFAAAVDCLRGAEERVRRSVNPTVYPPAEFRARVLEEHSFVVSVLKEPKIFLIGDEVELQRVAERRAAPAPRARARRNRKAARARRAAAR